jgi:hypothetical protein
MKSTSCPQSPCDTLRVVAHYRHIEKYNVHACGEIMKDAPRAELKHLLDAVDVKQIIN